MQLLLSRLRIRCKYIVIGHPVDGEDYSLPVAQDNSMFTNESIRLILSIAACCLPFRIASGQGTHRVPDASNPGMIEKSRRSDDRKTNLRMHGKVLDSEGGVPQGVVEINLSCPTFDRLMATIDSKGRFSFGFESTRQSDAEILSPGCFLFASLDGYSSEKLDLSLNSNKQSTLGQIVLTPLSTAQNGIKSVSEASASSNARKRYELAIDKGSHNNVPAALGILSQLVAGSPQYSLAWLALGVFQEVDHHPADAKKSYLESIHGDSKFAPPLIYLAALEAALGDPASALEDARNAINLNPGAFPRAYAITASADLSLRDFTGAETAARSGLKIDRGHQYAELEFELGVALKAKGDQSEAKMHLEKYIASAPNGTNVEVARQQIAGIVQITHALAQFNSAMAPRRSEPLRKSFALANTPLLANASAYTCLETVQTIQIEPTGQASMLPLVRLDVALVGGKEIYSAVKEGSHFSERTQRNLLLDFRTTGLFNALAKTLIDSDIEIASDGQLTANGHAFPRYSFHSTDDVGTWAIKYAGQSGIAGQTGWFLVGDTSPILKRAFISASAIPKNLGLAGLTAMIDYDVANIVNKPVLLPVAARIEVGEQSGRRRVSFQAFNHCRAFAADSVIKFDDADSALPPEQHKAYGLPDDMQERIALESAINLSALRTDTTITGRVMDPVIVKGKHLIDAGALVEGHVRPAWSGNAAVLELDRVQSVSGWIPFYATLSAIQSSGMRIRPTDNNFSSENIVSTPSTELPELPVPGVATILFDGNQAELPSGTVMIWKTRSLDVPTH